MKALLIILPAALLAICILQWRTIDWQNESLEISQVQIDSGNSLLDYLMTGRTGPRPPGSIVHYVARDTLFIYPGTVIVFGYQHEAIMAGDLVPINRFNSDKPETLWGYYYESMFDTTRVAYKRGGSRQ